MAARRNTTPLFEIVSRNGQGHAAPAEVRADEPHAPEVSPPAPRRHVVLEEDAAPAYAPARETDPGRDIPRTMGRISVASGTVRLPLNYAYIALSGVLVLALLAWTVGYLVGGRNADEKARREIETATGTGGPALRDPLAGDASPETPDGTDVGASTPPNQGGSHGRGAPGDSEATPISVPPGLPAISDRRTPYLAPGGFFEAEPRAVGLNYFCLVSRLPEADAARALDFLAREGVVAMGLEHERSTANNRLFDLYTLEPIPSENFRTSPQRQAHEARLRELGRRWRSEERGTSDFGQPLWKLFRP